MELPSGTVTMLFSDVEGSTKLLAALGDQYGEVLSTQRRLLRAAFGRHHGSELGTEGDSFFLVFASALDAVGACIAAQRELAAYAWPRDVLPLVRMGLHTGEPTRHEDGYIGMDVHRAARIAASAHGGQVVMSESTCQLVAGRLPGASLTDLGWHRLKDMPEPEHLHQLQIPGLRTEFPPLKSLGMGSNLPEPATPFIARARELRDVRELVSGAGMTRLVTVTGPGGVGKSRLALAAAESVCDRFQDGVYFVPLAPVTQAAVMWTTIAEALGVVGDGRSPPTFFEHIKNRRAMLVLDNLEQLPDAGDVVAQLIGVAPHIVVMATSRRPLHVPGEQEYPVRPLPVPRVLTQGGPPGDAVELFVRYARMARPDFAVTAQNASDVVAICDRLDGLPLALELAAARMRLLSPQALLARLDRSLEFEAGCAGRPDRQRTLRDTVAWSYDLLSPGLRAFFRRMGAFSGGCDLAAVAAVARTGTDPLDGVAELADASLVSVRDGADGEPRVGMLQTMRAFARERLAEAGELDEARSAHASFYAGFAEALSPQLQGPRRLAARDRLEAELENVRGALGWCLESDKSDQRSARQRATLGLRLCQAMSWFWYAFGYTAEGHRWQRLAVTAAAGEEGPDLAEALHGLALLLMQQGEVTEARDALTTCVEIWRRVGDRGRLALELSLGVAHWTLGDIETGRTMLRESIDIASEIGDESRQSNALSNLGAFEVGAGNTKYAIELLEQARVIDEKLGNVWGCAVIQANLVAAMLRAGRPDDAYASLRGKAADMVGLGDIELTIDVVELFASIFAQRADPERAARLLGTAEALRKQAGMPIRGPDAALLREYVAAARASVSAQAWDEQRLVGHAWNAEDALAEAGAAR